MIRYARICISVFMLLLANNLFAQDSLIHFDFSKERLNDQEVLLKFKARIPPGIELFALQKSADDPLYSTINSDSSDQKLLKDSLTTNGIERNEYDSLVQARVRFFSDSVEWFENKYANPFEYLLLNELPMFYRKVFLRLPSSLQGLKPVLRQRLQKK